MKIFNTEFNEFRDLYFEKYYDKLKYIIWFYFFLVSISINYTTYHNIRKF